MNRIILLVLFLIPTYSRAQTRPVEFAWDKNPQAVSYEGQIFIKGKIVENINTTSTQWQGQLVPGKYQVKLRSVDKRGVPGPWSESVDLEVLNPRLSKVNAIQNLEEVAISWQKNPIFTNYEVVILRNNEVVKKQLTTEGIFKYSIPPGNYTYKVKGLGSVNSEVYEKTLTIKEIERKVANVETKKVVVKKVSAWEMNFLLNVISSTYFGENKFNSFSLPVSTKIDYKGLKGSLDLAKNISSWKVGSKMEILGQSINNQSVTNKNFEVYAQYYYALKSFKIIPSVGLSYKEILEFIPTFQSQGEVNTLSTLSPEIKLTLKYESETLSPYIGFSISPVGKTLKAKEGDLKGEDVEMNIGLEYKTSSQWSYKLEFSREENYRSYSSSSGFLRNESNQIGLGLKYEF